MQPNLEGTKEETLSEVEINKVAEIFTRIGSMPEPDRAFTHISYGDLRLLRRFAQFQSQLLADSTAELLKEKEELEKHVVFIGNYLDHTASCATGEGPGRGCNCERATVLASLPLGDTNGKA